MLTNNEIILLKSIITDVENYICNCCPCISYVDTCSVFPRLLLLIAKLDTAYNINSESYGPNECFDIDTVITDVAAELAQHGTVEDTFYKELLSYYYITLYYIISIKDPTLLSYFNIEVVKACISVELQECIKLDVTDITVIATLVHPTYYNVADGQITLEVTGGTGTYTYLWNDDITDANRTDLAAGEYTVIVTDSDSNTATLTVNLIETFELTVTGQITSITSPSGTGSIQLGVIGGTAPYTYVWSTGALTQNITELSAGTYSVTVTDANNYEVTESFTLEAFLNVTLAGTDISCNRGTTGAITTTVTGGKAPFTYLWNTGASTANLTGLTLGNYSVKVTDSYGNYVTKQITLTQPAALRYSLTIEQPTTVGGTGRIILSIAGGQSPYTYLWNDNSTASSIVGVAGTYSVVVTDTLGCTLEITDIILYDPMVCTSVNVSPTCYGDTDGSITLTVTGGVTPYTYDWSDTVTTKDRTELGDGTYTVMITDNGGRFLEKTITLTEPDELVSNAVITNIVGSTLGSIVLTPTGGTGLYTYLWNTGATTSSITSLTAGTYSVTITDTHSCTALETYTVQGDTILLTFVTTNVLCNSDDTGAIILTVSGGTAPFTYMWNDLVTTKDRTGLEAGIYSVVVTDVLGQTGTSSVTVTQATVLVITPEIVYPTVTTTGSITLTVSGGTPFIDAEDSEAAPYYSYLWEDSSTASSRDTLAEGTYSVVVTDASGCTTTMQFILTTEMIVLATTTELDVYTEVIASAENIYEFTLVATGTTPGQIGFKFPDNFSLDSFQILSNSIFTEEDLAKWTLVTADGYKTYTYTYMTGEPDPYNEFIEIFETQTYKITLI